MPGRTAAFLIALAIAVPALAQEADGAQEGGNPPPERIVDAEVFGDDPCPKSTPDTIVVCRRLPEQDRYRLPERFRAPPSEAGNSAWARRAETIDEVSRVEGGLPNTCSPIGSGGHTGCTQAMIDAWYAERRARRAELEAADEYEPE